jgi:cephalosporin hydroxylase
MSIVCSDKWKILCGVLVLLVAVDAALPTCGMGEPPANKEEIIRDFNLLHYNSRLWNHTTWMGIQTQQNPCDMWVFQEILWDLKPDFVIETGTFNGGSSLFFAMVLAEATEKGRVISVDINPHIEQVSKFKVFRDRVEVIKGDSVSPEVIDKIAEQVKGHVVLVTLDSLHTKDHVLKELKLYSKFVSVNSYLIVQDTNVNGHPVFKRHGPGPMEAVEEFLKDNKDFEIDRNMERHMLTYYPSGYLKRVR